MVLVKHKKGKNIQQKKQNKYSLLSLETNWVTNMWLIIISFCGLRSYFDDNEI